MDRHGYDPVSFGFGALFLAAGLVLLTGRSGAVPMEWVGPAVAVGLGLLIVYAARPRRAVESPGEPASDEEADR
jgi:cytochrome c-type biogenesis protein CcmH/NrfF